VIGVANQWDKRWKILTFDVWFWPQWLGLYTPEMLKYRSYSYKVLSALIRCIDCKTITLKSLDSVNRSQIPVFCLKIMAGLIWFLWQILGVEQICCSAQYRTQFLWPILIYHIHIYVTHTSSLCFNERFTMHRSAKFQTPPNAVDLLWSCEGLWRGLSFMFSRSYCHLTI